MNAVLIQTIKGSYAHDAWHAWMQRQAGAAQTEAQSEGACTQMASLASGEDLSSFSIQARDICGARAGSSATLECILNVTCAGLDPAQSFFPIDAAGVAVVRGKRPGLGAQLAMVASLCQGQLPSRRAA